ncbi:uncharacterized protein [Diadema antillarum]|uniref:uncharacterized protein n=1 Tax=Diadema antillarum TaxID=105358 RepID=UPI003A88FC17
MAKFVSDANCFLSKAQDTREVLLGDDIHVQCSHPSLNVDDFKYSISWAKQTHILSTEHNLTLTIRNFSVGDVGRYQCNITSESGVTYIAHQTVLTTTAVINETIRGHIGASVSLSCPARSELGKSQVAYWEVSSNDVPEGNRIATFPSNITADGYTVGYGFSLTIQNVAPIHEVYKCYQPPSQETAGILLTVSLHPYEFTNETIKGRVGENVTFSCPLSTELSESGAYWTVFSNDFPEGKLIASSSGNITAAGYTIGPDFSLSIDKVSPGDDGSYECIQNASQEKAGVSHTVAFHAYALPVTSPLIDGCRGNGKQCEQTIFFGTHANFNCSVENVFPEKYPTWGEHDEYIGQSINSDGTFNTWCVVFINSPNTPAERRCSFALETYNETSDLRVKGYQEPVGWMISTYFFAFLFLLSLPSVIYTLQKFCWRWGLKRVMHEGCNCHGGCQEEYEV